jgi:aspartate carbamoyltransferase catalytic subunit
MRHLLDVDELTWAETERILARAAVHRQSLASAGGGRSSTAPESVGPPTLAGRRVGLLFAEPSTRTRLSFEIAARQLGAETFVIDPGRSSLVKGETLADTVRTLGALGLHALVMRHHRAGAPWVAARYFGGAIVNAGDGWHAHPTQALLDVFTLRRALGVGGAGGGESVGHGASERGGRLAGRKVVIVGVLLICRVSCWY